MSPRRNLQADFWRYVEKTDECWLWRGPKKRSYSRTWYGVFNLQGKKHSAHRYSWELVNGSVPEGLNVNHREQVCTSSLCVNPNHLYVGTQADNVRDMIQVGTFNAGGAWRGKRRPKEHGEAIAVGVTQAWTDPEKRARITAGITRSWQDPERRRKQSEAMRTAWKRRRET